MHFQEKDLEFDQRSKSMKGFCLNQLFSFFDVPIALSAFVVAQAPKYIFFKAYGLEQN